MIKTTIQNRIFKITTNKKTYTVNAPNKVSLYAQSGGIDYANMTLDTSPADADVIPVNGTRNATLSQLKISLANIKSYVLGTLFETSASNIKTDGEASVGSLSAIARADHVHPVVTDLATAGVKKIYAGTSDMTAGSTSLASGTIYLMYE